MGHLGSEGRVRKSPPRKSAELVAERESKRRTWPPPPAPALAPTCRSCTSCCCRRRHFADATSRWARASSTAALVMCDVAEVREPESDPIDRRDRTEFSRRRPCMLPVVRVSCGDMAASNREDMTPHTREFTHVNRRLYFRQLDNGTVPFQSCLLVPSLPFSNLLRVLCDLLRLHRHLSTQVRDTVLVASIRTPTSGGTSSFLLGIEGRQYCARSARVPLRGG
jgi:hypothetical protein